MKHILIIMLAVAATASLPAQSLSLQACLNAAADHYPLARQKALDARISNLNEANIRTSRAPQVSLNGQATYQSDVTSLGISLPGVEIPTISKDQYRLTADVNYVLFDGGISQARLAMEQVALNSKAAGVDAEILKVQEQVMEAYFRALLFEKNADIMEAQQQTLKASIKKVDAMVEYGVAMQNQADVLKMEMKRLEQRKSEAIIGKAQRLATIALLTGLDISREATLQQPDDLAIPDADFSARPEFAMLSQQKASLQLKSKLETNMAKPKAILFGQGGYGRPGLNFLDNSFSPWYMGGIRLSWNLSPLYSLKRNKQINTLSSEAVDLQREVLDMRLRTMYDQQTAEAAKLRGLMVQDSEIITLSQGITKAYAAQLENGVITSDAYTRQLNAETQSRLSLALHETQLLMALHSIRMLTGL